MDAQRPGLNSRGDRTSGLARAGAPGSLDPALGEPACPASRPVPAIRPRPFRRILYEQVIL
jgi:hypothetical protein